MISVSQLDEMLDFLSVNVPQGEYIVGAACMFPLWCFVSAMA